MADCKAVVKVDAGNVRQQPVAGTAIIGIARRNDQLLVQAVQTPSGQTFRWFQVVLPTNGLIGWIREDLVQLSGDCTAFGVVTTTPPPAPMPVPPSPVPSPPTPTPVPDDGDVLVGDCKATVKVFLARVRNAPNASGAELGMLKRGTAFTATAISPEDSAGFHWIGMDFQGQTGWTREDLLDLTGDCLDLSTHNEPPPTPVPTPTPPTPTPPSPPTPEPTPPLVECMAKVSLSSVNIRSQPTTSAGLLGQGVQGDSFKVLEVTAKQPDGFNWIKIDFRGKTGFVRFDVIALEGSACSQFTDDDRFPAPVASSISQGFKPNHQGLDFPIPIGNDLRIPVAALVVRSQPCPNCQGNPTNIFTTDPVRINQIFSDANWGFGYGECTILQIAMSDAPASTRQEIFKLGGSNVDSIFILYAHQSQRLVEVNQRIPANTVFGRTGHTGFSSAPHLHLEVAYGKQWTGAKKIHPSLLFNVANVTG